MRFALPRLSGALLFGVVAIGACSAPDEPTYGPPNSIIGRKPPPPSTPPAGATAGGGDGGTAGASDGGTTAPAGACVEANFVGDQACAVKWSTTLFPLMKVGGKWNCSGPVGCHGTAPPVFTTTDAKTTFDALRAHKLKSGTPYINPCSKDPAASYILGNFNGTQGNLRMPVPQATAEDTALLKTWVECGAPFN